ncbi:MAG: hypothetical protein QN125_06835 [Armatimonadota bacterium]|nr:hypothetical protein [Armatimonadota bacterium]
MDARRTTLAERIGFAEDWVVRARRQIQDGDLVHGTLTLLLAQAELRRAREVGTTRQAPARPWAVVALGIAVAAAVAVVEFPGHAPLSAQTEAPIIVALPDRTGALLQLVTVPEPAAPVEQVIVRAVAPARPPAPAPAPALRSEAASHVGVRSQPVAPPAPVPAAAPVSAAPAASPAPASDATLLSAADVIDLVLAAERSLRRPADR